MVGAVNDKEPIQAAFQSFEQRAAEYDEEMQDMYRNRDDTNDGWVGLMQMLGRR